MRTRSLWTALAIASIACGDDGSPGAGGQGSTATSVGTQGGTGPGSSADPDSTTVGADGPTSAAATTGDDPEGSGGDPDATAGSGGASTDSTGAPSSDCDYETIDGRLVIEAESLPVGADWQVLTDEPGFYGDGYIGWTGPASNNDPGQGVTSVTLFFAEAGRYRMQWRNRIGMGTNATEHNDTWVSFPDASALLGVRFSGTDEDRVYPRPLCEDGDAMAAIEALPQVTQASCPAGSSADGFFKVYSSGATDWSWSTRTSDSDPHEIMIEIGQAGDYTMTIAARADWHLIDRIVIAEESLDNATVQDPRALATTCR